MNHLIGYNESNNCLTLKNIIEDLKYICVDLTEDGFAVNIVPENDIKIKFLSFRINYPFYIEICKIKTHPLQPFGTVGYRREYRDREAFSLSEIDKDIIYHLLGYMNTNGFNCKVESTHPVQNNTEYVYQWGYDVAPYFKSDEFDKKYQFLTFFLRVTFTKK